MTQTLDVLLAGKEPMFTIALRELEDMTGKKGIDVAYIADIMHRAHALMREIGLDPADTTEHELYSALNGHSGEVALFHNMSDVGLVFSGERAVSFNIDDVHANTGIVYEQRQLTNMRSHIEQGLLERYEIASGDTARVATVAEQAGLHKEQAKVSLPEGPKKIEVIKGDSMPNILCVGDIITDAFIKLSEEHAEVTTDEKGYKRLSFELGAKLPYDDVQIVESVECSPNAAVSLTRLGIHADLMTWIGSDSAGKDMVKYLNEQGVGTNEVNIEEGMKSNYHYVLRYGADRTKLQKFEDYSYQWHDPATRPDWLYLGVLGEKTWPLHEAMLDYLNRNPDIKLVFQPGMYHLMWGTEKMAPFYRRAEVVILNREEGAQVTGRDRSDIRGIIWALHDLGVTIAVVTDGPDGAFASRSGEEPMYMPNYPDPKPPLDRTGAGDAFASTIAAALALDQPLGVALQWAPINSMSVVQQMGAQAGLLDRPKLEEYLASAAEDYKPRDLE